MQSIWNMIISMIMCFLPLHIVFIWKISHRTVSISATEPPCINSLIFSGAISGCRILLCVSSFINDVEEKSSLLKVVEIDFWPVLSLMYSTCLNWSDSEMFEEYLPWPSLSLVLFDRKKRCDLDLSFIIKASCSISICLLQKSNCFVTVYMFISHNGSWQLCESVLCWIWLDEEIGGLFFCGATDFERGFTSHNKHKSAGNTP